MNTTDTAPTTIAAMLTNLPDDYDVQREMYLDNVWSVSDRYGRHMTLGPAQIGFGFTWVVYSVAGDPEAGIPLDNADGARAALHAFTHPTIEDRRAHRAALEAERTRRAKARGDHREPYDLDYRLSSI